MFGFGLSRVEKQFVKVMAAGAGGDTVAAHTLAMKLWQDTAGKGTLSEQRLAKDLYFKARALNGR
ncbi:MAG: hypothetical protein JWM80_4658 [Cyanobacteria bacterium RYN_339]|nr:hypothetical protein [Cyanobacteria bacterium RYN_339]